VIEEALSRGVFEGGSLVRPVSEGTGGREVFDGERSRLFSMIGECGGE
jgi:hypothetical protein